MNEEDLKKELGITNFRHLTKAKILQFASCLDKIDPEVAKKIIEQFPEFCSTMQNIVKEYKDSIKDILEKNDASTRQCIENYDKILDSLKKILEENNLSFEERKYVITQMKEIAEKIDKKDSENKTFLLKMVGTITAALGTVAVIVYSVLGGKATKSTFSNPNKIEKQNPKIEKIE